MCAEADRWVIAHHPWVKQRPSVEAEHRFLVRIKRNLPADFSPDGDDGGVIRVIHSSTRTPCLLFYNATGIQTYARKHTGLLVTYKLQLSE